MIQRLRSLIVRILALWHGRNQKEIGAVARMDQKEVSKVLRGGDVTDEMYGRLLRGVKARPAEIPIVTGCLEALDALDQSPDLGEEELLEVEEAALGAARLTREASIAALRRSRVVLTAGYPVAADLAPARLRAVELLERLKGVPEAFRPVLARIAEQYQSWALVELCCEESVRQASRDLEEAASWARLAAGIAELVRGPERWRLCLLGYAKAHGANVLRVLCEFKEAEAALEEAKRLWKAGSDPDGVLDPGRLLEIEASLCRELRRFDKALALLDEELALGRSEASALIQKGFTLEVMGEYERGIETLLRAIPWADQHPEPRLKNIARYNLAILFCHVGRFRDAMALVEESRPLAVDLGAEIDIVRLTWVEGRIAAGLGQPRDALRLLETARRKFLGHKMIYDAALALLEEAVLLLDDGQTAEAKALAQELGGIFESKGVHREAVAALRLFHEAAECEEATAELARSVLRFLFRARYDQSLRFTSS